MELDILHRAVAPEIVEFFGAFTIESCVYYCMEYMNAGSLDALTGGGVPAKAVKPDEESPEVRVPEPVLRRITAAVVRGLGFLKDELQIMHRGEWTIVCAFNAQRRTDVKPTNVLINKKGEIKLCDFGVSGQLEKSLAKTNIGCQSYMAVCHVPPPAVTVTHDPVARTNQGRIAEPARHIYRLFRCLVRRPVYHRTREGLLPLSSGNLRERLCAASGDCLRSGADSTQGIQRRCS